MLRSSFVTWRTKYTQSDIFICFSSLQSCCSLGGPCSMKVECVTVSDAVITEIIKTSTIGLETASEHTGWLREHVGWIWHHPKVMRCCQGQRTMLGRCRMCPWHLHVEFWELDVDSWMDFACGLAAGISKLANNANTMLQQFVICWKASGEFGSLPVPVSWEKQPNRLPSWRVLRSGPGSQI